MSCLWRGLVLGKTFVSSVFAMIGSLCHLFSAVCSSMRRSVFRSIMTCGLFLQNGKIGLVYGFARMGAVRMPRGLRERF